MDSSLSISERRAPVDEENKNEDDDELSSEVNEWVRR
jgi:hypothetical protein